MIDFDKAFEEEWNKHFKETEEKYNSNYRFKLFRWFSKSEWLKKNTIAYKLHKSIAKLFFSKGALMYAKYISSKTYGGENNGRNTRR